MKVLNLDKSLNDIIKQNSDLAWEAAQKEREKEQKLEEQKGDDDNG